MCVVAGVFTLLTLGLQLSAQPAAPAGGEVDPAAEASASAPEPAPGNLKTVALLPLRVEGELPEHVRRAMEDDLGTALERGGEFRVVRSDETAARSPVARRCEVVQCFQEAARATQSQVLLLPQITVYGRDYEYKLTLIDGATGEALADSTGTCDTCGHEEARAGLVNEVAAITRKIAAEKTTPPALVVRTVPAGARVTFDGELLGVTPLEVVVDGGEHDIRVEKAGHIASRRRIAFVDGVTETLELELAPVPSVDDPRAKLLRGLGWAGVGLGAGALVGAGVLIGLEERPITLRCSGENVDYLGNCKYRYATVEGGVALAVTGVALVASGITMLVLAKKRRGRALEEVARLRPSLGAGGLTLRF